MKKFNEQLIEWEQEKTLKNGDRIDGKWSVLSIFTSRNGLIVP
jgi:hypothetical protein